MAAYKVTAEVAEQIRSWKAEGRSSRDIASTLLNAHGIKVDQRTISTYAKRSHPDPKPVVRRVSPAPPQAPAQREPGEGLDEIETLESQAVAIKALLDGTGDDALSPRDWAVLNGELRQTFSALRKARHAAKVAQQAEGADVAWIVAKLKRFAEQNKQHHDDFDSAELSEERDTALGE